MNTGNEIVIIRGGGDLATGVIQKFYRSGIRVLVLETERPSAIRRTVSLSEAVYAGQSQVEDVRCVRIDSAEDAAKCWESDCVPLLVDPRGESIYKIRPAAVIDAIIAKRNLGTAKDMAPVTIALGPGFSAGIDVDAVIETKRGHDLGRLILSGTARPNTGTPGDIAGQGALRVFHAPEDGVVRHIRNIGDVVTRGETLFYVGDCAVKAPFDGLLRGLIREGYAVHRGMKIADLDPRPEVDWHSISDKARCLGGAALEAFLYLKRGIA